MSADLLARLNDVFRDVFDDDDLTVTRDTTAADVDGWDSLMHVTLMLRIEAAFRVRLTSAEVTGLKNVGQLADLLASKVK